MASNWKIDVMKSVSTTNSVGERVLTWEKEKSIRGELRYKLGKIDDDDGNERTTQNANIICNYDPSLTTDKRLVIEGITYVIVSISPRGIRHKYKISIELPMQ